jgi:hypothetical protein
VYHDLVACPYGQEITRDGHDVAGTGDRRHCEWCEAHAEVEDSDTSPQRETT